MRRSLLMLALSACSFRHGGVAPGDGAFVDSVDAVDAVDSRGPSDGTPDTTTVNLYRKAITVQRGQVAGDVTGFPVWISLTGDADLIAHARDDHADVYFTDVSGAPIPYELTAWDRASGTLQAWVRAAHLTPSTVSPDPNVMYVVFGGGNAPLASSGAAVFDNGFQAVWHLDDASGADATAHAPGTIIGTAPTVGSGELGKGLVFANTTSAITFTNPITGAGPSTFSAWVNETAKGAGVYAYAIVVLGTPMASKARWLYSLYGGDNDSIAAGLYSNDHLPNPAHVIGTGAWHKVDWVYDSGNASHLYIDGSVVESHGLAAANTTGTTGVIANAPQPISDYAGANGTMAFAGTLDEVRLANTPRSAQWVATEFNNQKPVPAPFYVVGPVETQ